MSTDRNIRRRLIKWLGGAAVAAAALGAIGGSDARAGDTWDGSGSSNIWSNGGNWGFDHILAPANDFTEDIFFGAVAAGDFTTAVVNINWDMDSLTFLAGAPGMTIEDDIAERFIRVGLNGITNNDATAQTFNVQITVAQGAQTWRASSGSMIFNRRVSFGSHNLTLDGDFNTIFNEELSAPSSARSLRKRGAGRTDIGFSHNGTGALWTLDIEEGTVRMTGAGRLADGQDVSVASGAVFDLNTINDTISSLTGAGSVTLGTGTLTVGSDGSNFSFSGVISENGGLTKIGAGTFTLSGGQTYVGATTISEGRVEVNTGGSLSDSSNLVVNSPGIIDFNAVSDTVDAISGDGTIVLGNATLTIGGGEASGTWSGSILQSSGTTGNLIKTGVGTQTFSADNVYTGTTTIQEGILSINGDGRLGSGGVILDGGTLRMTSTFTQTRTIGLTTNGGAISVNSGVTTTQSGALTGANQATDLEKLGTGTLVLTASNSFQGDLTITAGTVRLSGSGRFHDAMDLFIDAGGTLDLNGVSDTFDALADGPGGGGSVMLGGATMTIGDANAIGSFSGVISESGGLTKVGTGTITLTGVNTYTGATTVNAGTLVIGVGGSLSTSTDLTVNAGTMDFDVADAIDGLDGSGSLLIAGDLTVGSNHGGGTFSGQISGTGALVKTGTGMLVLSGDNNTNASGGYDGTTTINNGVISISSTNNLGNGGLIFGGGTLLSTASFTQARAVTLNGGASTFDVQTFTTLTQSGAISGVGGLTKAGTGILVLSNAANGYGGTTTINNGILRLSGTGSLPNTTDLTIADGATYDLNGVSDTIDGLAGQGIVNLGGATLTTGSANGSSTFGGTVVGNGVITKTGSGTLILNSDTGFTGTFNASAGTVRFSGAGALSNFADVTVGGTLDLNGVNTFIDSLSGAGSILLGGATLSVGNNGGGGAFSGSISETGSLLKVGGGVLTLSGANSYTGTTTISGGTLRISSSGNLGGGGITLDTGELATTATFTNARSVTLNAGGGTLNVAFATTLSQSAAIGGAGGLTKAGGGTLILSASNTYAGPTDIDAGVLSLSGAGGLPQTTDLTMSFDTELRLNGANQSIDYLVGPGVILLGGGDLTLGSAGSVRSGAGTTFSGSIQGAGRLIKIGDGSQNLSGVNAHTVATLLMGGTLAIHDIGALGADAVPLIFDGGKLHAHSDITGLRREQSHTRGETRKVQWDAKNNLWKICPLADWTERDVWNYIFENDVPYNKLHDQGYSSIGCTNCTIPGEGREGRWAGSDKTECGLHG